MKYMTDLKDMDQCEMNAVMAFKIVQIRGNDRVGSKRSMDVGLMTGHNLLATLIKQNRYWYITVTNPYIRKIRRHT